MMKNRIGFWIGLVGLLYGFTLNASPLEHEAEENMVALYHNPTLKKNRDVTQRIVWFSEQYLGKAYFLGALGEGSGARYDQFPLYRIDAFDCETYVDTVLALALANNFEDFKPILLKIRYQAGKRDYLFRNHFTDLDWNLNNQQQGFIKDITASFKGIQPKIATAEINKPQWYIVKPLSAIRLNQPNQVQVQKRHAELITQGKKLPVKKVSIAYLPLKDLFDAEGKANKAIFAQIPQAAIIEIVRPNWDLTKVIGTHLNVSHLGFAIWKNNILYFRQASLQYGRVIDVPLETYLVNALHSPTIKGINIQQVINPRLIKGGKD